MQPKHPGEVLLNDFLEPNIIQQTTLASHLGWPYARLNEIINMKRGITAGSALSLSEAFNTTPEFWLHIQVLWDLFHAKKTHIKSNKLPKSIFRAASKTPA